MKQMYSVKTRGIDIRTLATLLLMLLTVVSVMTVVATTSSDAADSEKPAVLNENVSVSCEHPAKTTLLESVDETDSNTFTVSSTNNTDEASIGDVIYDTFAKALQDANSGDTITLLKDVNYSGPITIGSGDLASIEILTIDMNGNDASIDRISISKNKTMTLCDSSGGGGGTVF